MEERQSFTFRIGGIMPVTPQKRLAHVVAAQLLAQAIKDGTALTGLKEALILSGNDEKMVLSTLEDIIYYHKVIGGVD